MGISLGCRVELGAVEHGRSTLHGVVVCMDVVNVADGQSEYWGDVQVGRMPRVSSPAIGLS
jgi:hypothetical protein